MSASYQDIAGQVYAGNENRARALLEEVNEQYYNDGSSPLTDAEFDRAQSLYTTKFGLPFKTGHRVAKSRTDRHAVAVHDWPLLSGWLAKAAGKGAMVEWFVKRVVATMMTVLYASPKWDGMSLTFTYDRFGVVKRVVTRGDDGMGVDATKHFEGESHFGGWDFGVEQFGVKYEAVMGWGALEELNVESDRALKNPRNTVAGIISSDDSAVARKYLTLVPLEIEWDGMVECRAERLEFMQTLFCGAEAETEGGVAAMAAQPAMFTGNGDRETPFYWWGLGSLVEAEEIHDEIHALRETPGFDYMIDGVVLEFADEQDITRLGGRASDCPDYAIAVKFPSLVGHTHVLSVDFDLGNTGRRTPCVNYEPITMDGRTFSRTSMANFTRFDQLKLCPGTPILVEIRGDVIGWIDRDGSDPDGAIPFVEPDGLEFTYNKHGHRVFAYSEAPLAGRVERMMVKMGVRGVRIETIKKIVDAGLITRLGDIFRLDAVAGKVASLPGMGINSTETVCSAVGAKLAGGLWDWEILASVGILNVGRTLSKEALKVATLGEYIDVLTMRTMGDDACSMIASRLHAALGPVRSQMILEGITNHLDDIEDLASLGPVRETKTAVTTSSAGPKHKIVITGDLQHWERDAFKDYVEMLGHKVVGSVSKNSTLLLTNDPSSGTVKNRRARELGVQIVTENEIIEMLGLEVPVGRAAANPGFPAAGQRTVPLDDL